MDDHWLALEIVSGEEPLLVAHNKRAPVARLPLGDRVWRAELRAGIAETYDVLVNMARWFQVHRKTGEVTEHRPHHVPRALRFSASGETYYTLPTGPDAGVHWFDTERSEWRRLPFPETVVPYCWDNAVWGRAEGDKISLLANRSAADDADDGHPRFPFARFMYDDAQRAWGAAESLRLSWGSRIRAGGREASDTVLESDITRHPHALQTSWMEAGVFEDPGGDLGAALWLKKGDRWRRWSVASPWLRLLRGRGEGVCAVSEWGGITWVEGRRARRVDAMDGLRSALDAPAGWPRLLGADLRVDSSGTTLVAAVALLRRLEASASADDPDWLDTAVCLSSDGGKTWRRQTPRRRGAMEGRFVDVLWAVG